MTDVEELLRDTLTDTRYRLDPQPAMYELVRERARLRRRRHATVASATAAAVAVVVAASVVGVQQAGHHHQGTPLATTTASSNPTTGTSLLPQGKTGQQLDLGMGDVSITDLVTTADALYVLTATTNASTVVALSPTGGHVKVKVPGPAGTPEGLAVSDGKVWTWSQDTNAGSNVRVYDARTLGRLGDFSVKDRIYNVAAIDGELFMSTSSGLYVTDRESESVQTTTRRVAGISGATYGLAADPARDRVIVGVTSNGWGARIDAVDVKTLNVTQGAQTVVGKESIAVVDDQIWVGGFANGDTKVLFHLDAKTLRIEGLSPALSELLRPGAIVWPGQHVLWATTPGDAPLSCVDPRSGAVLAEYGTARGPVTSVGGSAYALSGGVVPLVLTGRCTG